jgi:Ca2+-binding RTX toxin-like protein
VIQRRVVSSLVLAACAAGALLPAAASAAPSEAFYAGGDLNVGPASFGDAQRHEITVRYDAGTYRVSDTAGVVVGFGCVQVDATHADCSDAGDGVVPFGAAGNDDLSVASVGPGDSTGIHGFGGDDRITGSPGVDFLVGYRGNDTILGGAGGDRLLGGPSQEHPDDDTLDGGTGPDYISGDSSTGGVGHDTVLYSSRPASEPVTVTLTEGFEAQGSPSDDGGSSDGSGDTVEYVENVVGGAGNDVIVEAIDDFGIKDNVFRGGPGSDLLVGGDDGDELIGEAGADRLQGGRGADRLAGGDGGDLVKGEDGPDQLFGDGGGDRLLAGPKGDRLTGGPGADLMKGQGQKDLIFARDNRRDRRIDCGPGGRKEAAQRDRIDPNPISC